MKNKYKEPWPRLLIPHDDMPDELIAKIVKDRMSAQRELGGQQMLVGEN